MLVGVGCGKTEPKPLSPEEQKLVGSYELPSMVIRNHKLVRQAGAGKLVLLENRTIEFYRNGELAEVYGESKWKIVGNEVHFVSNGGTEVNKIEPNGGLTGIATISNQEDRFEIRKSVQSTFKKLKE
jgi:hypothetical protein